MDDRRHPLSKTKSKSLRKLGLTIAEPAALAKVLGRSKRWVYDHAVELGGVKIGGTWIFTVQGLKNAVQRAWDMESASHKRSQEVQGGFQHAKRSRRVGGKNKVKARREGADSDPNRHGLARVL